jgi:transglutaminase-like putative cysteine protease
LASSYWIINLNKESPNDDDLWDPGFDVKELITEDDISFYSQYENTPRIYKLTKNTITLNSDITFGQQAVAEDDLPIFSTILDRKVILYDWVVEGAQVTPSIENLANRILRDVGYSRVEQAKAIFNFVANYIEYSLDGAYEYPVTTLLERKGQCSEYATLLTSLYLASGFKTVYVLTLTDSTDYFQMGHIYIALYLPEYEPTYSDQWIITSRLGSGWLGLDATNNQCRFGELFSYQDFHSNIKSIVEPVTSLTIYDVEVDWSIPTSTGDGQKVHLDVYLKTWEAEDQDTINLTFKLYEYGNLRDEVSFLLPENQERNLDVELEYLSISWIGSGEQYITIGVS